METISLTEGARALRDNLGKMGVGFTWNLPRDRPIHPEMQELIDAGEVVRVGGKNRTHWSLK